MGHVYIPGLKVTERELVSKRRILPLKGEVVVKKGDAVKPNDTVARAFLPGSVELLNIAGLLGIDAADAEMFLKVKQGEHFDVGQILAENKGFFGLFKTQIKAPFSGTLKEVSRVTGQAVLNAEPIPIEVKAYIPGKVVEIIEKEGVVVETVATFVQGIFGIGGERTGKIHIVSRSCDEILDAAQIDDSCHDKIIIGGGRITAAAIRKAQQLNVRGIVAGGIDAQDVAEYLGYDIGVAITGSEDIPLTVLVTEGFGNIPMAKKTFEMLKKYNDCEASINGATQIRAGVIRPEVIIQQNIEAENVTKSELKGIEIGSLVRVIRVPYFGKIGKIAGLPPELRALESETHARVCEIEFLDGEKVMVPRANLEMIEE